MRLVPTRMVCNKSHLKHDFMVISSLLDTVLILSTLIYQQIKQKIARYHIDVLNKEAIL